MRLIYNILRARESEVSSSPGSKYSLSRIARQLTAGQFSVKQPVLIHSKNKLGWQPPVCKNLVKYIQDLNHFQRFLASVNSNFLSADGIANEPYIKWAAVRAPTKQNTSWHWQTVAIKYDLDQSWIQA